MSGVRLGPVQALADRPAYFIDDTVDHVANIAIFEGQWRGGWRIAGSLLWHLRSAEVQGDLRGARTEGG